MNPGDMSYWRISIYRSRDNEMLLVEIIQIAGNRIKTKKKRIFNNLILTSNGPTAHRPRFFSIQSLPSLRRILINWREEKKKQANNLPFLLTVIRVQFPYNDEERER